MSESSIINFAGVAQVCIVVKNVDEAVKELEEKFDFGPWEIQIYDENLVPERYYHGKPADYAFKAARTLPKEGMVEVEIIEPLHGPTIYQDFLDEHGEGLHHFGWHTVPTMEEYKRDVKALEDAGYVNLLEGVNEAYGFAFCYFDLTQTAFHTILEVVCRPSA